MVRFYTRELATFNPLGLYFVLHFLPPSLQFCSWCEMLFVIRKFNLVSEKYGKIHYILETITPTVVYTYLIVMLKVIGT